MRSTQVAAQTNQTVPRVRRFVDLRNQLKKLNENDAQVTVYYMCIVVKNSHTFLVQKEQRFEFYLNLFICLVNIY